MRIHGHYGRPQGNRFFEPRLLDWGFPVALTLKELRHFAHLADVWQSTFRRPTKQICTFTLHTAPEVQEIKQPPKVLSKILMNGIEDFGVVRFLLNEEDEICLG